MRLVSSMAWCLFLTVAIEVPLVLAVCPSARSRRGAAIAVLVNVMTNPVVVASTFLVQAAGLPYWPCVAVLEAGAVAVEGYWYDRTLDGARRPFAMAFLVNLCSFSLGFVFQ